jgi:hypothetical protein
MLGTPVFLTKMALWSSIAAAQPVLSRDGTSQPGAPAVILGEKPRYRTVVVVVCLVLMFLLALAQGKQPPDKGLHRDIR